MRQPPVSPRLKAGSQPWFNVFPSFFKKKRLFSVLFLEKKNQKTFANGVYLTMPTG
jgi:hypothetical protein